MLTMVRHAYHILVLSNREAVNDTYKAVWYDLQKSSRTVKNSVEYHLDRAVFHRTKRGIRSRSIYIRQKEGV